MRAALLAAFVLAIAGCGEVAVPSPEESAAPEAAAPESTAQEESAASEVRAVLSDEAYLVRLGLMRGHLLVGHELYALGARDAARTHSRHPTDELYAGMDVEFAARGTRGFGVELEAHAAASQGEDATAVGQAYAALTAALARSEAAVAPSPAMIADVIVALLREAAAEYAIGIVDGRLANAHEYQDAYGFTQVALAWAARGSMSEPDVFDRIGEHLGALSDMWPSLVPPDELDQRAARLYGTAADAEILALDLPAS